MTYILRSILLLCAIATLPLSARDSREVLSLIEKVNDSWQASHSPYTWAFWDHAAYYTGNMEAYRLTGKAQYYQYSDNWCRHNDWKGATGTDKKNWKYKTYGEGHDFVLFGDWQICFQTYIDMYHLVPADYKVARAREVMQYLCAMKENQFWWWSDALYMVMPVMTKMYRLTGDEMYLDRLTENFLWSDSLMWDAEAQLYYRDAKYIWPKVKTSCDGGKSFWARGDGWVLAGLAKVLADMPRDYRHRGVFVKRFQQLAQGVARCQRPGGYWSRSMLCEADAPGPETSGTAFFCYGLEWGVNNGYLSREEYGQTIERAWSYLRHTALQADGSVGYVQPIGEKPDPTKIVDARSQAPFGTGAWLLAACERVRYLDKEAETEQKSLRVMVENPTADLRQEVVELEAGRVFRALGIGGGRQLLVKDGDGVEMPYQLTHDGKLLFAVNVYPSNAKELRIYVGRPQDYRLDCNGRVYPNREDDLAWETDRNAWRLYGPKMRGKGMAGFDVFTKNQPAPIQDQLYQNELNSYALKEKLRKQGRGEVWILIHRDHYTYHRDRGQGMDAYTVGQTLGAGAPALLRDNVLLLPDVYERAEILDNGPLRFCVRLAMTEREGVRETRLIRQDRGSHLARVEVRYEGSDEIPSQVCAGIVVRKSVCDTYWINRKAGYVAYADAMDTPRGQNGHLYIACLFPGKVKTLKYLPLPAAQGDTYRPPVGHVVGVSPYRAGETFTYYAGTAWSKYDVPTMAVWQTLLEGYARNLRTPLIISY